MQQILLICKMLWIIVPEWNKSLDYILQSMKLPNVDEELMLELLGIAHTNDTAASIPGMALQVVEFSNGEYKIRKIFA